MPTNLAIDDRLLEEAQKIGRHRTKRETVTVALQEYIDHRKQQEILSLFGKIDYERGYDYKRERKAKHIYVLVETSVWSLALRRKNDGLYTNGHL
jgi:hypothetical protein